MGSTFEGWTGAIVFSVLVVVLFGIAISQMNDLHGGDYKIKELNTTGIESNFHEMNEDINAKLKGGDVSFGDLVLSLSTSWDILISMLGLVLNFLVAGGWIQAVISFVIPTSAGTTVAIMLRGLWIMALFFILLRILFKRSV